MNLIELIYILVINSIYTILMIYVSMKILEELHIRKLKRAQKIINNMYGVEGEKNE